MRSDILRARVTALRLRIDAPWPSQLRGREALYLVGHKPKAITQRRGFHPVESDGICPIRQVPHLRCVK
jgi:hypothetical protein